MRTHTSEFKEKLKVFGRQIQGKITYYPSYDLITEDSNNILTETDLQIISEQANYNDPIEISEEDIFSINIIKNGDLLQSLMKEFDFESKIELNIGSVVNPQLGLLVDEDYEYLDYGNYIINSKEFNMDTETWSYVCYDKMLFSMVKYRGLSSVEYPITIKQFINKLCDKVGLEFENSEFVNQGQLIYEDLYKNRDVTYRDIFDEISKIVAGNLLINDDDKLEVGYPKNTVGKNLFDKNSTNIINGYFEYSGDTIKNSPNNVLFIIPCENNTNYAFTQGTSSLSNHIFQIATANEMPALGTTVYDFINIGSQTNYTYTTNSTAKYLLIRLRKNDYTDNNYLSTIQVEKNSTATEYEEYGLDKINENYLKDTNVRMSEKIGVINSVAILDSDNNIEYVQEDTESIKANEMTRVTITDNLLALNGDTDTIALNILNKLNGLYYYANDLQTTGVCYYDFLDMFNIEARGNIYQCLLLNNEITITQGIEEHIFTERFEEAETSSNEYTTSVMTNKQIQFNINQQEGRIESKVEKDGVISAINQSAEEIQINADKLSLEGKNINLTGDNIKITGENLDIDSKGVITLSDNSAEVISMNEEQDVSYIVESEYKTTYQGNIEQLTFKNQIFANGRKNEYENNNEISSSTGYGHYFGGISESLYRYPWTTWYMHTADYDISTNQGYYGAVNISSNGGIWFYEINNGVYSSPLTITSGGDITCVRLTQTSKEENKKNFEKLTNAKDILNQVDIYKYNFKDEEDNVKKSIGFVIGDKFNYSEEITSTNNDGANIYSMVSVLWQVVKEQQEEINELKEMIKNGKY